MKLPFRNFLEPRILGAIAAVSAVLLFAELAEEVAEGETRSVDKAILLAFREPGDVGDPLGPRWLEEFARDVTALGSIGIVTLLTLAIIGFLLLARHPRSALFVAAATASGMLASHLLKLVFERERPDLVPHAAYVATTSFPSGHAMLSAVVYLTLGALLARMVRD
ncbi:MAG: phosphatase PAP2 family protein, partial [Tistlia sp.]